jgi:hypothetical protein
MTMDRVQVLKHEDTAQGGSSAWVPFPVPIDPTEDAVEARGLYIQSASQRDEQVLIDRDNAGNMRLKDSATPPTLLGDIATKSHVTSEVGNHAVKKDNPHEVTAAQTGAVPATGGTFTGPVVAQTLQIGSVRLEYNATEGSLDFVAV